MQRPMKELEPPRPQEEEKEEKEELKIFIFYLGSLILCTCYNGGARGVMFIVTGYGHGDTSSIPGQD